MINTAAPQATIINFEQALKGLGGSVAQGLQDCGQKLSSKGAEAIANTPQALVKIKDELKAANLPPVVLTAMVEAAKANIGLNADGDKLAQEIDKMVKSLNLKFKHQNENYSIKDSLLERGLDTENIDNLTKVANSGLTVLKAGTAAKHDASSMPLAHQASLFQTCLDKAVAKSFAESDDKKSGFKQGDLHKNLEAELKQHANHFTQEGIANIEQSLTEYPQEAATLRKLGAKSFTDIEFSKAPDQAKDLPKAFEGISPQAKTKVQNFLIKHASSPDLNMQVELQLNDKEQAYAKHLTEKNKEIRAKNSNIKAIFKNLTKNVTAGGIISSLALGAAGGSIFGSPLLGIAVSFMLQFMSGDSKKKPAQAEQAQTAQAA